MRSGVTAGFNKNLAEALQLEADTTYSIDNLVRPSLMTGVLKGSVGTPGLVAAISAEKDAIGNIRLSTSGATALTGKTFIYKNVTATNGTQTLYTVPAGKTFYIISAGLTYHASNDDLNANLFIDDSGNTLIRMQSHVIATYLPTFTDTIALTYPYPLAINAGSAIKVFSENADIDAHAWIVGYLEDA